jgi:hypothetical protein
MVVERDGKRMVRFFWKVLAIIFMVWSGNRGLFLWFFEVVDKVVLACFLCFGVVLNLSTLISYGDLGVKRGVIKC